MFTVAEVIGISVKYVFVCTQPLIIMTVVTLNALHLQHNDSISADNTVLLTVIDRYSVEMIPLGDVI